jgi:hypothetical protein
MRHQVRRAFQGCIIRAAMMQMNTSLEFAECPLGHPTPIRPAMFYRLKEGQESLTEDVPFVVVACSECKRVYKFATENLKERAAPLGLSPYSYEAPIHAFQLQIRCDERSCDTPLSVIAVRKRNTTAEELLKEQDEWTWENLTCPSGHAIPDRPPAK